MVSYESLGRLLVITRAQTIPCVQLYENIQRKSRAQSRTIHVSDYVIQVILLILPYKLSYFKTLQKQRHQNRTTRKKKKENFRTKRRRNFDFLDLLANYTTLLYISEARYLELRNSKSIQRDQCLLIIVQDGTVSI